MVAVVIAVAAGGGDIEVVVVVVGVLAGRRWCCGCCWNGGYVCTTKRLGGSEKGRPYRLLQNSVATILADEIAAERGTGYLSCTCRQVAEQRRSEVDRSMEGGGGMTGSGCRFWMLPASACAVLCGAKRGRLLVEVACGLSVWLGRQMIDLFLQRGSPC